MRLNLPIHCAFGLFPTILLMLAVPSNAQLLVDDFADNQILLVQSGPGDESATVVGGMLGGERDVQISVSAGSSVSAEAAAGVFQFVQAVDVAGALEVTWDGTDGDVSDLDASGLGTLDFTAGGQDAFLLGVNSSSHSFNASLVIHSPAGTRTSAFAITASSTPVLYRLPFSVFSGTGNFTEVGAVELAVASTPGLDVHLDFLRTTSTASLPPLEATLADVLLVDSDGNGIASAGDTLRYVVTIVNNDSETKTGVEFNADLPAHTILVPGLPAVSPLARDESAAPASAPGDPYHTSFATTLAVAGGDPNQNPLDNDFLGSPSATIVRFGGGSLGDTVDSHASGTTALTDGHSLTVNPDGSFSFTPQANFTGLFSFEYRLANSSGSDTATVTIAVGERPAAADDAFSVTGNVQLDTATLGGLHANDDGDALVLSSHTDPSHGTVFLDAAAGSFVYTPDRGYTGADSFTYTIGNGFGSTTATVNLSVSDRVWFIDAAGGGGDGRSHSPYQSIAAFNAENTGGAGDPAPGDVVLLREGTYTEGLDLLDSQKVVGDGWSQIFEDAAGFALAPGSGVESFSGTAPVIAPGAGNGVNLAADNAVRGISIGDTPSGYGLSGGAVGDLVVAESSVTGAGGAINITAGGSFGGNVNFETLESTSSAGANLNLVGVTGFLGVASAGSGFSGSTPGSSAVRISGGDISLSYGGTVSKSNAGALLDVSGGYSGTLNFGGPLLAESLSSGVSLVDVHGSVTFNSVALGTSLSPMANPPLTIVGGSGTYSFGELTVFADDVRGFYARNVDGTIAISSGTIDTGAGAAIDIQGPVGLTTLAITLTTVSSIGGSATGVSIQHTDGSFTVTGSGMANSGGTVSDKVGADGNPHAGTGVYLHNCSNISFSWMRLQNHQNFAILGSDVRGFVLSDAVISGVNGTSAGADEGSVGFNNLTGSVTIRDSTIEGGIEDNLRVVNSAGVLDRITLDTVVIGLNSEALGDHGVFFQARNSAVLNATVEDCVFLGARGDVFQLDLAGSASGDLVFRDNTSINNHPAVVTGGGGMVLSGGGSSASNPTLAYDIQGNTFRNARGHALLIALQTGAGAFTGQVRENVVGDADTDRSGSSEATGIEVRVVGGGAHLVTISDNQVRQFGNYGILLQAGQLAVSPGGTMPGAFYATVTGNQISNPSTFPFAKNGIHLNLGLVSGDTHFACVDLQDNTTAGSGDNGGPDIQLRQRQSTSARIPGYVGGVTDEAAVTAFVDSQNPGSETVVVSASVSGGGFAGGGPCVP